MNGVNWSLNGKITSDLLKCIFSYIVNGFVAQNDERHFFAIQCKVEITFSPENWATIAGSILRGYANSRLCKHPNVVWLNFAPSCKPHGQKCILIALLKKCILLALLKKCCKKRRNEKSTASPRERFAKKVAKKKNKKEMLLPGNDLLLLAARTSVLPPPGIHLHNKERVWQENDIILVV